MARRRPRNVVVLGSTGSVGVQALQVASEMPERFRVVGLAAHSRWEELARQAREFRPEFVMVGDEQCRPFLEQALNGSGVELLVGPGGLAAAAAWRSADVVLSAVSGAAGIPAAVAALGAGKLLALANKESVVTCGPLIAQLAQAGGGTIVPVDSEHSALFQLLAGVDRREVASIVLTASGGPFWDRPREEMLNATPQEALAHPTWRMGPKIAVDSATLMNKALEVIEARWLFDVPAERIRVLIHPQSIVHGMVELVDGSVLAQMGPTDMRLPIRYALSYPERATGRAPGLDLARVSGLEFYAPDPERYPALALGYRVAEEGGTSGAVLSAADEVAVGAFLAGEIGLADIVPLVAGVLDRHEPGEVNDVEDVLSADRWAREEAKRCLASL